MRRLLALLALTSVTALGLAAGSAPPARAIPPMPLAIGGCMETPLPLSDTATIARTCASWDGTNLALWVEGSGLAQEFTAVGSASFNLFGYILTIEARAGMRHAPFGGWEAFAELTKPFAWGPITIPLQVAEDGSRVTLWINTSALTTVGHGVGTYSPSSTFTLTFLGPDGTTAGTLAVPMGLSQVAPPSLPTPDVHPSTPGAPAATVPSPPAAPPAAAATEPAPTTAAATGAAASPSGTSAPGDPVATSGSGTRIGPERASLGRY